ncbi:hypothetical protein VTH82DRAFT_8450 [Thermothelomyces myriococcoides]
MSRLISFVKQTNTDIVKVLRQESEVLVQIQNSFDSMLSARRQQGQREIEIACFFEELPLPMIGHVVPQHSATLPGYIGIGIHGNHRDIARFVSVNDPGFTAVCRELRRWMEQIGQDESVPKDVTIVRQRVLGV